MARLTLCMHVVMIVCVHPCLKDVIGCSSDPAHFCNLYRRDSGSSLERMGASSSSLQVDVLEAHRTVERFRVNAVPVVIWIRDAVVVEYKGGADALKVVARAVFLAIILYYIAKIQLAICTSKRAAHAVQ
jgi:hypothetical protein